MAKKAVPMPGDSTILYLLLGAILISNVVNFYQVASVYSTTADVMKLVQAKTPTQPASPTTPTTPTAPTQPDTPDVEVKMTVLNDKTCSMCDASGIISSLKTQVFNNLKVTEIDYSSAEGKSLAESMGIEKLPAYIFDGSVISSKNYQMVQQYLQKSGSSYLLRAGGNMLIGREATTKPTIALFVMSHCPYGTMAEDNMKEVVDTFKDSIDFKVYFIANDNGQGGFDSLHGQPEVDENIRQLCAMDKAPTKWFDYILCRNKNIQSTDWQACATGAGIDANTIKTCSEGTQGKQLLTENIKLANELQIGSSPTFLINNRYTFGGALPAEGIKQNLCQANPGLAGCEKTLSGAAGAAPAAG